MTARTGYWVRTRRLTIALVLVWAFVTFVINWFADDLNHYTFLGFPLGFYLVAQGEQIFFLFLIWVYNRCMVRLDAKYGIDDE
jgi:putative solute:sodium symporter small subunit